MLRTKMIKKNRYHSTLKDTSFNAVRTPDKYGRNWSVVNISRRVCVAVPQTLRLRTDTCDIPMDQLIAGANVTARKLGLKFVPRTVIVIHITYYALEFGRNLFPLTYRLNIRNGN